MTHREVHELDMQWRRMRPRILVIACSDGRLQQATDAFLAEALGIRHYDRLYVPGGGGCLSAVGGEVMRAYGLRRECQFLVEAHRIDHLILLFHGPAVGGPTEAVCADYQRKHPSADAKQIRAQQEADLRDLLGRRHQFAGKARVSAFRIEVSTEDRLEVATLHEGAESSHSADARQSSSSRSQ